MISTRLEHVNITVSDPSKTAIWLADVFGWHIRWQGEAINGGYTIHIGTDDHYLAIYNPKQPLVSGNISYTQRGGLNHVAIVVDDLDAVEARVVAAGFTPVNHADYEPGRRFYFRDNDNVEYEIVSYDVA